MKKSVHLHQLRKNLDAINKELVLLIAKRIRVSRTIYTLKKELHLPIHDQSREIEVLHKTKQYAKRYKVNQKLTEKIMKDLIKEGKKQ